MNDWMAPDDDAFTLYGKSYIESVREAVELVQRRLAIYALLSQSGNPETYAGGDP